MAPVLPPSAGAVETEDVDSSRRVGIADDTAPRTARTSRAELDDALPRIIEAKDALDELIIVEPEPRVVTHQHVSYVVPAVQT